mmetsp:Transcript_34908/g.79598  ORF Transcript_34908/g.79598 Transcript_34908/m.79598 type:complete len:231 (-) Transcript_34908:371-1063(-)
MKPSTREVRSNFSCIYTPNIDWKAEKENQWQNTPNTIGRTNFQGTLSCTSAAAGARADVDVSDVDVSTPGSVVGLWGVDSATGTGGLTSTSSLKAAESVRYLSASASPIKATPAAAYKGIASPNSDSPAPTAGPNSSASEMVEPTSAMYFGLSLGFVTSPMYASATGGEPPTRPVKPRRRMKLHRFQPVASPCRTLPTTDPPRQISIAVRRPILSESFPSTRELISCAPE